MKRDLQVGDKIKCANPDDLINTMNEIEKCGYQTDFCYEVNGVKGYYLEILNVRSD